MELIENVRVLVKSVSGEAELRRTDLSTVLEHEVENARNSYEETTFATNIPPGVEVTVEERDDGVHVAVADNGPGIEDEFKETYFDPGEQDEGSVGQGLGLYLVDTLVQRYGGDVWFEDNDPRDTVCKIRLPLA